MKVNKKDLEKSQIELSVELNVDELKPYIDKAVVKVSKNVKIEGFRPGRAPLNVLKAKIGEMTILEEAAHLAINKTIDDVIEQNIIGRQAVGQPQVNVTKLAPNNSLEYKIILSLLPQVSLGKYKDLKLTESKAEVSDKDVDRAIEDLRANQAQEKVIDRAVKKGDKVVVDINILLDKVPVENGQHKDLAIIMGNDYFVPGFDEKLFGAKKGEFKKFELKYPKDHHQKNLAGKLVQFEVKIKEVYERQLPKLDDKFAEVFKLKNLDELKKGIRENILQEKKRQVDLRNESALLNEIINATKFGNLPEVLIDSEVKNMLAELEQSVIRQGAKFDDYLQSIKKDRGALMLEFTPNAVKRVKSALVIKEISQVENIVAKQEEINAKINELKKQYTGNKEILKMLDEHNYYHYLENILTNEKVIAKLKEWNYGSSSSTKQKS